MVYPMEPYYIAYRQPGEPERRAGFIGVDFSPEPSDPKELELLERLSRAAYEMNGPFRDQFCPDTSVIEYVLDAVEPFATPEERAIISGYRHMLALQNGPWSLQPRKNHLLGVAEERMRELAEKAGAVDAFLQVRRYFYDPVPVPGRCAFYPADLTEEELTALGGPGKAVNSAVVRLPDGRADSVLNEELYAGACARAAAHLREAREFTDNLSFRLYLDAKICELESGSEESRRVADYHWIRHDSPVDIIISTALEVYLDDWKNLKGSACAAVTRVNRESERLLEALTAMVPDLERSAPWTWRREKIDPESLPRLKYVDVLVWTGDYITGPMTVSAQSLPNDEWVGKNIGTVNMVYLNTNRAVHRISGSILADLFLTPETLKAVGDLLFEGNQLHSTLHEIGHTTGMQDPDHGGQPSSYFLEEYSTLEELRAELFGLWAAEKAAGAGVVSRGLADAAHYGMLLTILRSLVFVPSQAHTNARNIMYHYLTEQGAILRDGDKFLLSFERLHPAVRDLLGRTGDLKATGDLDGFRALKERYCYDDPERESLTERSLELPLGRGLIFPLLREENGKKVPVYGAFTGQPFFTGKQRGLES